MDHEPLIVPEGWHQVTLKQLSDLNRAIEYPVKTEGDKLRQWYHVLAALTSKPVKEVSKLPYPYILSFEPQLDWLRTPPTKVIPSFVINGIRYNVTQDIFNAPGEQYAAITEAVKLEGDYNRYALCTAVMCLPEGEVYNDDTLEARAALFWEHLTIDIALPYTGFFLTVFEKSLPIFQASMLWKRMEILAEMNEVLTETEQAT